MKHLPEEITWHHGCPNTSMRNPVIQPLFESYIKEYESNLSLHMSHNAPHYSSKETRIAYTDFLQVHKL